MGVGPRVCSSGSGGWVMADRGVGAVDALTLKKCEILAW